MTNYFFFTKWEYSTEEWNEFVETEKANKKEDSIYFGIGILIVGTLAIMLLRNESFIFSLMFSIPFALLIPWLRMRYSYSHLKKDVKNPYVEIYQNYLIINGKKIELFGHQKKVKNVKIITTKNNKNLLEFDVQWKTRNGYTNDEFRILIPSEKLEEARNLIPKF